MQAVLEVPDNAVPQSEPESLANPVYEYIERIDFSVVSDVIAHLPAEASIVSKYSFALADRVTLLLEVLGEADLFLVILPDIIRG